MPHDFPEKALVRRAHITFSNRRLLFLFHSKIQKPAEGL